MADFVVLLGWTPADYWRMRSNERDAILTAWKRHKKNR